MRQTLRLDRDGDVWLCEEDEATASALWLGRPRLELYHRIPQELWPAFEAILRDHEDASAFGVACKEEDEATYRRQRL